MPSIPRDYLGEGQFSLRDFLQDRLVERKVGHGTLQARILFFQFPQPLEGILFNASISTRPSLVGRHADANGSHGNLGSFACRDQPLGLTQLFDDFFRCMSFLFHESFYGAPRRYLS
jgi:hypothetical protein